MEHKGINYDTGTKTVMDHLTRNTFNPEIVAKEIDIIKNELHCNAIRISGIYIERIVQASEIALQHGLTVWFSPSLPYDDQQNTLKYVIEASTAAEDLRQEFQDLIFIAGCELSLFTAGFVKGTTGEERMKNLFGPVSLIKNIIGIKRTYNLRLNKFLSKAVAEIRKQFHGKITYASGTWEKINWKEFDLVGVDLYQSSFNKSIYLKELQHYKKIGKPVCIMEFGCCSYVGADDKGAMGWAIVDWKKKKPELKGSYTRDERTQSNYLLELLNIFDNEKIFAAFVFTFILENYIYHDDPVFDLDIASYGIVKALGNDKKAYKDLPWLPKRAFFEVGKYYGNTQ